jgi:hypothetical protein
MSIQPRISNVLAGLPDEPKNRALGDAVPPANLGCGRATYVLSDQAFNGLRVETLIDTPLWATSTASSWSWRRCL